MSSKPTYMEVSRPEPINTKQNKTNKNKGGKKPTKQLSRQSAYHASLTTWFEALSTHIQMQRELSPQNGPLTLHACSGLSVMALGNAHTSYTR